MDRIGIMGPANAGKDTAATILSEILNYPVRHFSDSLYAEVSAAFSIPVSRLQNRETKEKSSPSLAPCRCTEDSFSRLLYNDKNIAPFQELSPRQVLEWWGTDYRRSQDARYWIRRALREPTPVIFADVRYQDEADICTQLLRIVRPEQHIVRAHASDQLWRNRTDVPTIVNDGTLEDLRQKLMDQFAPQQAYTFSMRP